MGNLVEIKREFLFNTLTAKDFGVYTDSDKSQKVLFIRKFGMSLFADGNEGVTKSASQSGRLKVSLYKLNTKAPAVPEEYEEIITIDPKRKTPGWDELPRLGAKTYGGTYNVSVSSGLITDASIANVVNEIASQVDSDPEAIVEAGYAIHITSYADTNTININGHGVIAGANLAAHIALINATSYAKAFLVPDGAGGWETDQYILIYKEKFVSAVGADLDLTDAGYLGVAALDVETQFEPKFINTPDVATDVDNGLFPFLTSDDVRREFAAAGNHGELSEFSNVDKPIVGADYTKYTIWAYSEAYNNQTPGGDLKHKAQIHVYVLTSLLANDIWDASDLNDDTGGTPDNTFDELLTAWQA